MGQKGGIYWEKKAKSENLVYISSDCCISDWLFNQH
jgi:hypothetical protein